MKRYKVSLTDQEAEKLLGKTNPYGKYRFTNKDKAEEIKQKRAEMRKEGVTSQMSALKTDGELMNIDEYCLYYGIDRSTVKSFKLITHTSVPYYNILSNSVEQKISESLENKIQSVLDDYKPRGIFINKSSLKTDLIAQIIFTDTHVGMEPNGENKSLYGGSWGIKDLEERRKVIIQEAVNYLPKGIDCLQVLQLGDFADGLDGKTVRREHDLPQNLTNEQVFDGGFNFMTSLFEDLYHNTKFNKMKWYNVCNSNHSSSFDYFISQAFKSVAEKGYKNVLVINEKKFIGHFTHGIHCEMITHGKDDKSLKFGFKPYLDERAYKKIDDYIKFHKLHDYIINFHKGDSHLSVVDKTNQHIDYNSYLALSPSSSWVQTNFASGRSGFSIIIKDKNSYSGTEKKDFEFKWNSNELK